MKQFKFCLTVAGFAAGIFIISSCNNRNTATDGDVSNTKDTMLIDSRRNTTDTVNYLTKDSGNQSKDVVDPNTPGNSH